LPNFFILNKKLLQFFISISFTFGLWWGTDHGKTSMCCDELTKYVLILF